MLSIVKRQVKVKCLDLLFLFNKYVYKAILYGTEKQCERGIHAVARDIHLLPVMNDSVSFV